jgi:hypothetical protein
VLVEGDALAAGESADAESSDAIGIRRSPAEFEVAVSTDACGKGARRNGCASGSSAEEVAFVEILDAFLVRLTRENQLRARSVRWIPGKVEIGIRVDALGVGEVASGEIGSGRVGFRADVEGLHSRSEGPAGDGESVGLAIGELGIKGGPGGIVFLVGPFAFSFVGERTGTSKVSAADGDHLCVSLVDGFDQGPDVPEVFGRGCGICGCLGEIAGLVDPPIGENTGVANAVKEKCFAIKNTEGNVAGNGDFIVSDERIGEPEFQVGIGNRGSGENPGGLIPGLGSPFHAILPGWITLVDFSVVVVTVAEKNDHPGL